MNYTRKPWQEPMVWLMVGIPAFTVLAGIITFLIIVQSGPLDDIATSVSRVSQAQNVESIADKTAAENNYRGFLIIDQSHKPVSISLKIEPVALTSADIRVVFVHPNLASKDIETLLRVNSSVAELPDVALFNPQQIVVSDVQNHWRLVGTYQGQSSIKLTPALPVH